MSAQMDPISWIIPSIISAIVAFLVVMMNRFSKTTDTTITGTVEIKGLQENLSNLRNEIEHSFDKMEHMIEEKTNDLDQQIEMVKEKVSTIRRDIDLNTYRIQQLEDKHRGNGKNGGVKSAI